VCIRGNNIGAGERNRELAPLLRYRPPAPSPQPARSLLTCGACCDWQDRVQREAAAPLGA
jgi:hypothetical protein